MAGRIDVGGFVRRLTRRTADDAPDASVEGADDREPADTRSADTESAANAHDGREGEGGSGTTGRRSVRGVSGRVKGALGRSRTGARRTADKVRSTARRLPVRRKKAREALPVEGIVTIEYSPRRDGDPDPGEVVWAWVPFEEDPTQGKDRPVIIIGRRSDKLVGIPLTTRPNDREAQLKIGTGGWDPKRRTSYARIWRMLDIDPDHARREGAVLDMHRFEQLVQTVDRYYDVHIPVAESGPGNDDDWDY